MDYFERRVPASIKLVASHSYLPYPLAWSPIFNVHVCGIGASLHSYRIHSADVSSDINLSGPARYEAMEWVRSEVIPRMVPGGEVFFCKQKVWPTDEDESVAKIKDTRQDKLLTDEEFRSELVKIAETSKWAAETLARILRMRKMIPDDEAAKDDTHPAPVEFSEEAIRIDPILEFFHYAHLPPALQARSQPFCALAMHLVETTPRNAERSVALRKLLEAKDAAVRAAV